jgi:hypothetical protein
MGSDNDMQVFAHSCKPLHAGLPAEQSYRGDSRGACTSMRIACLITHSAIEKDA